MASKYPRALIDKYPRTLRGEPTHLERVAVMKKEIIAAPDFDPKPSTLAHAYALLRAEKERLEKEESALNVRIDALAQIIVEACEREGITGVPLDTGQVVRVQLELYAQVVDKEAYRLWCIANGYEKSLQLAWGTTNADMKARLVEGLPEQDGVAASSIASVKLYKS